MICFVNFSSTMTLQRHCRNIAETLQRHCVDRWQKKRQLNPFKSHFEKVKGCEDFLKTLYCIYGSFMEGSIKRNVTNYDAKMS